MMTKFSEMKYERPDLEEVKAKLRGFTKRLSEAPDFASAKAVFLEKEEAEKHINSMAVICSIRHSVNTKDEFYDAEEKFWNNSIPELQEVTQLWTAEMLKSPFRADLRLNTAI